MSQARPQASSVSPVRKAAIVLTALGEEAGAEILRRLSEDEIQRVSKEVAQLGTVPKEQTDQALAEYYQMAASHRSMTQGGFDVATKLLKRAFGPDQARNKVQVLTEAIQTDPSQFEELRKSDPAHIARFLNTEHPQTIALILSHLTPSQAAPLLVSLPAEIRPDVIVRMATLDRISPEVVSKIAGVVTEKLRKLTTVTRESCGGTRSVAQICNHLDGLMTREMLEQVELANPAVAEKIRNQMFAFDDILKLDAEAVGEVVSKVDRKTLVLALKGTSEQLKEHFTKRMSGRAKDMLFEDLDALGPVKIKEVEAAQQQVISVIRELEQQGALSMRGGDGEQLVV